MKRAAGMSPLLANSMSSSKRAIIRFVDIGRTLHGAAGQADLVPDQLAAAGQLVRDPGALDLIAVFDGHARLFAGEMTDLLAHLLRDIQARRHVRDDGVRKRHQGSLLKR